MLYRYLLVFLCLGLLPLRGNAQSVEFIRNDGQWGGPFSYKASTGNGEIFLAPTSITYLLGDPLNRTKMDGVHHGLIKEAVQLRMHAYRMSFIGSAPDAKITSSKEQTWYYNYFLGNDPKRWKSNIHPALALDYAAVYPGIDLHISSKNTWLEYEWILKAGADPEAIRMKIEGADGLRIKGGNLVINTSVGDVEEMKPVAFQYTDNGRREVACRYVLTGHELSYEFPEGWDKSLPLVIDPTVVFCSMTGSTADNWGFTATYDASGNFYAGGIMLSYPGSGGGSYPATTGAFQTSFAGGVTLPFTDLSGSHGVGFACDIAIMKLNPTGTSRLWATYIGGSDNEQPHSLIVDNNGDLVVAGVSFSSDYPVTSGCYDNSYNGKGDIVVTKLNSSGSALTGSTFVGGDSTDGENFNGSEGAFGNLKHNYGDNARSEVIVDRSNNVYVTASSKSPNFPTTTNGYQRTFGGGQDAVFIKLNPSLSTLTYSTFLGGSSDDAGYVLALDTGQTHVYVGGGTMSSNFPATGSAWKNSYQGNIDGFIARFGNSGTYPLQKTTFVGTGGYDQVYGVQVDLENNVYAMGQTLGGGFPVTSGVYSNPNSSQFVIKMDSLLATDVFSTVFGSSNASETDISPVAFLVDTCQNIYISGWGGTLAFTGTTGVGNCNGMPTTPALIPAGSVLKNTTDSSDFYFIVLSKNAISLLFGAYHGRTSADAAQGEHVDGGTSRFDRSGVIYQAICGGCIGQSSSSPAYPTTSGAWSTSNGSVNCNEVALKIAFQLGVPDAIANASPKTRGCPPLTVNFQNTSTNAISYQWDFRDGSALDTNFQPTHTFTTPGIFQVRLVAYNPNACKVRDTTYVTISVDSNHIRPDFTFKVTDSCGPFRATFTNTSGLSNAPGAAGRTFYTWSFGDGSTVNGGNPGAHSYSGPGTYTVVLLMSDSLACNNPDSVKKVVNINGKFVKAVFDSPDTVCLSTGMNFINKSENATSVTWNFGDGTTSTSASTVVHTYANFGTYTVTVVAVNPNSCNKRDTLRKTIRIKQLPTADFDFVPVIPIPNTPVSFTNKSTNADFYAWTFGDGAGSSDISPTHLYRHTGSYSACLKAYTKEGCADSICKRVDADVNTAIDVPTAFSPNGDGSNDILYVRGGGLETMSFKVFNRWGQKVFETTTLARGWDGTYNGQPSPVDGYAYVLTASFIDGTSVTRKGNITLLR